MGTDVLSTTAPASTCDGDTGDVRVVAGRYEIRRVIGRGGMGVVYEAENTWTHRRVALKVLDPGRTTEPIHVERFMREARAASSLHHPHVVDVLDMGQDPADGSLYIVQELLVGEDLRALLEREKSLPPERARELLVAVLRGLAAAHAAGIVHRDIKPANVFIARGPEGELVPKIIDFGIARDTARDTTRTETGQTVGTPAYMSPEQLRGEKVITAASDVWSVGVMFYEMLSGGLPFPSDNYNVLVYRVLGGERPPAAETLHGAPPALCALIDRALSTDASQRFASAAEMLEALHASMSVPPASVAPVSVTPPKQRPRSSRVSLVALGVIAAAGLAFAISRTPSAPVAQRPLVSVTPPPVTPVAREEAPATAIAPALPVVDRDAATETPRVRRIERAHGHTTRVDDSRAAPDASVATARPRMLPVGGAYP